MRRTSFEDLECPIARSLEHVGEWWSILIMRDAFDGFTRFDEFERSLAIAPNMLTRRLKSLVDAGLLERRRYRDRPPRYEYVLTEAGRALRPVIVALYAWGNQDLAPGDRSLVLVDRATGREVEPVLVDRATGTPLSDLDIGFVAGPGATEPFRGRLASAAAARGRDAAGAS
ncbi:helix-turn-helix domain-containing protein [Catellatospora sp. NPDC049111]|uniref:winged helix-turn-helix transcriptional regulator n=1 Tax=Catellatospora sp. NPDC049111 TaxID=3155271 RepID=UPI0033F7F537